LTGESVPVEKRSGVASKDVDAQDRGDPLSHVFSGTLVVQGKGMAKVTGTGASMAIGKIGKALLEIKPEPTRVQKETAAVVKRFALAAAGMAIVLASWYGATRADWLNGLLVGLTLAMAILPEELPVVLTVFLAMYGLVLQQGKRVEEARALAFTTLVVANLGLIFAGRIRSCNVLDALALRNPALWWGCGLALLFLALVLGLAPLRALFHFERLHWNDIALCLLASFVYFGIVLGARRMLPSSLV
jgi:magnesium-transporting ATPase (P-type)